MVKTGTANLIFALLVIASSVHAELSPEQAESWARKNHCFKCHAIDKAKLAPAYKQVAEKFAGDPEGRAKVLSHLQSGRTVTLKDGTEISHKAITGESSETMTGIADWILSQ